MDWKNFKIGSKLAVGFGLMLILIVVSGLVGYSGLRTVGYSLVVISDEQVPIVDASKEMKLALLQAMVSMERFLGATSVMASADESALDEIVSRYQIATKRFDDGVEVILNGGWMGAIEVIKTDNTELAKIVREVAELHDKKYDATANKLMQDGRLLLVSKTEEAAAMLALEAVVDRVVADAASVKVSIADEIERRLYSDQVGSAGQAFLREEFPLADMAMKMKYTIAQTRILMEEYSQATDLSELDQLEKEYRQLLAAFDEMAAAILKGGTFAGVEVIASKNPKIRTMVEELTENHSQFEKMAEAMMAAHRTLIAQKADLGETMNRLDAAGLQAASLLNKVGRLAGDEMAAARTTGRQSSSRAIFWQIVVVGCSIVIGGLFGFIITRSLSRPIKQGVAFADEIAKGDFSKRLELDQKDEIGQLTTALNGMADNLQKKAELAETIADGNLDVTVELASEKDQLGLALKTMTDSLNEILGQIQEASEQIASGGGQVSDAAQSLSQGATEQASSLEEISASLLEMSSQTTTNAENANQANTLSDDAQQAAQKGGSQMQSMVAAMAEINEASQSISKIIKTIDEIAFQTNLLALNAAVEAARAGQHGKGFAVVAEEVRNLAARSARAAEETSALIEGSVEKTGNGSTIANQTAEALKGIVSGITNVSTLVYEISAASNEQAQGINQISQGVNQIDQVTQQNTAAAEQSAAAAEELCSQAEQMRQMLQRFTLKQGHKASTVSRVQPKIGWPTMKQDEQGTSSPRPHVSLDDNNFGKY